MAKPKVESVKGIRIGDLNLTILNEITEAGKDRRVYQVRDQHGKLYAYKQAKKRTIKKEVERVEGLKKANVPYAALVASGSEYVLRQWISGQRGDVWLKAWESFGAPLDIAAIEDLILLLDTAARAGLYIGKLDPEDMIWEPTTERWYIVDSGSVLSSTPRAAAQRYFWKMFERWGYGFDRYGKGLRSLFSALAPLGKDYPPEIPSIPETVVVAALPAPPDSIAPVVFTPVSRSSRSKPKPLVVDNDDDEDDDDDSSGELPEGEDEDDDDDDDSSGDLPGAVASSKSLPSDADLSREDLDDDDEDDASPDSEKEYEESLKNPPDKADEDMLAQVRQPSTPTKTGGLG